MKRRLRKSVRRMWWYLDGDLQRPLPEWCIRLFRRAIAQGVKP